METPQGGSLSGHFARTPVKVRRQSLVAPSHVDHTFLQPWEALRNHAPKHVSKRSGLSLERCREGTVLVLGRGLLYPYFHPPWARLASATPPPFLLPVHIVASHLFSNLISQPSKLLTISSVYRGSCHVKVTQVEKRPVVNFDQDS